MEEQIKALYNCKELIGDDSLVIWHNKVINKTENELTVADVARCIRQKMFLQSAYEMLLVYLLNDPYIGDVYEGEFMDKASEMENEYITKHKDTILEIIVKAKDFIKRHDWQFEDDKLDFVESIEKLEEKI